MGNDKQLQNKGGKGKSSEFVPCNSKSELVSVNQDGVQRQSLTSCANTAE